MIDLDFTQDMIDKAIDISSDIGKLKDSFTEGKRQWVGILGELALKNYCKDFLIPTDNFYNNDMTLSINNIDYKVEIKTKSNYFKEFSIAETSLHQKPSYYMFLSIICGHYRKDNYKEAFECNKVKKIYLCGMAKYDYFINSARFYPKGHLHPNNFRSPVNQYNIFQHELEIVDFIKGFG